jgi:hypothetical protein
VYTSQNPCKYANATLTPLVLNGKVLARTTVEYTRAWFDAQVFYITTTISREDEKKQLPGIFH